MESQCREFSSSRSRSIFIIFSITSIKSSSLYFSNIFDMLYLPLFSINFISPVSSSHQYVLRSHRVLLGSRLVCRVLLDDFWFGVGYERSLRRLLTNHIDSFAISQFACQGEPVLLRHWGGLRGRQVDFCSCDDAWHSRVQVPGMFVLISKCSGFVKRLIVVNIAVKEAQITIASLHKDGDWLAWCYVYFCTLPSEPTLDQVFKTFHTNVSSLKIFKGWVLVEIFHA